MVRPKIYEDASEDRVTLRIGPRLRKRAEAAAFALGQSLNFWIATTIEARLNAEGAQEKPEKKGRRA